VFVCKELLVCPLRKSLDAWLQKKVLFIWDLNLGQLCFLNLELLEDSPQRFQHHTLHHLGGGGWNVDVRKRVDPHLLPWLTMGSFYVPLQTYGGKLLLASWCLSVGVHETPSLPLDGLREIWYRGFLLKYVDQIRIFVQGRTKITDSLQQTYVQLWYLDACGIIARNTVNYVHIIWRLIGAISMPRN
jgi:hypothetical protein